MKKRRLALLLCLAMTMGLTACGNSDPAGSAGSSAGGSANNVFFYNHNTPVSSEEIDGVTVNYYDAIVNGEITTIAADPGERNSGKAPSTGMYLGYTMDDAGQYITDKGEWVNGNPLTGPETNAYYYTKENNGLEGVSVSDNTLTVHLDESETYPVADGFKAFVLEPNDTNTSVVATQPEIGADVVGAERSRAVVMTNDAGEATELYLYGLDTPEITQLLEKSIEMCEGDPSFLLTQGLQCKTADVPAVRLPPNYEEHAEPTKIFDNLYFVGGTEAGVYVFTDNGEDGKLGTDDDQYIMIDSGYEYMPVGDENVDGYIVPGMEKLGLNPACVKVILITHGSRTMKVDHDGGIEYFEKNFGTASIIFMDEAEAMEERIAAGEDLGFTVKVETDTTYTGDNTKAFGKIMTVTCGQNTVLGVICPRKEVTDDAAYTGFSYIAPVYYTVDGETTEHIWSTYGNTNVTGGIADMEIYHAAMQNFIRICNDSDLLQSKLGTQPGNVVDLAISNHPFVDKSIDRMTVLREGTDADGNFQLPVSEHPFIWGAEKTTRFYNLLDTCREVIYERALKNIDQTGTGFLAAQPAGSAAAK